MSRRRKDPLRALTDAERSSLEELGRATSAPAGVVARARALVVVADGASYTEAAQRVGRRSGDAVSALEAGPYQAIPQHGPHWRPATSPARYPHEHIRHGTAKLLTLFHPASGLVRVKGVTSAANAVLHPWLKAELTTILATLPELPAQTEAERRAAWQRWQAGLTVRFTLPDRLPPLRLLLVLDNLTGHKTPALVLWLVEHGIIPLYTPLSGSWLNMAESIQRILVRRALTGETPTSPDDIIDWLEATARGWNVDPTPFEWAGKRHRRRQRSHQRHHHALGGSGACARRPIHRRPTVLDQWRRSHQVTH